MLGRPSLPRAPGIVDPLRNRDFALVWTARTVSQFGDGVFFVAIIWQAYATENRPSALAYVGAAQTLPLLALVLVGGAVSDSLERRRLLVASDVVCMGAAGGIAVLCLATTVRLWHVCALAALYSTATAFFNPAVTAFIADVVPAGSLVQANSLLAVSQRVFGSLAGPGLGGLIVASTGTAAAFLVDGATFGISAALLTLVRSRYAAQAPIKLRLISDIGEGFRYVRARAWLWGTLAWAAITAVVTAAPVEILVPYAIKNDLHRSAGTVGLVLASSGVGAAFGSLLVGQIGIPRKQITFMWSAFAVASAAPALYGLAPVMLLYVGTSAIAGGCLAAGLIVWVSLLQSLVPDQLRGRVRSIDYFVSFSLAPVGLALVALVASAAGTRATLVAAGIVGLIASAAAYGIPGMRDPEIAQRHE